MNDRDRIIARMFDEANFKHIKWKPLWDFIEQYQADIDRFVQNGGRLSKLAEIISEEIGMQVTAHKVASVRCALKKKQERQIKSAPKVNVNNQGKKKWSDLELRTSKDFVDVDIRDL